MEDTKKM